MEFWDGLGRILKSGQAAIAIVVALLGALTWVVTLDARVGALEEKIGVVQAAPKAPDLVRAEACKDAQDEMIAAMRGNDPHTEQGVQELMDRQGCFPKKP